MRIWSTVLLGWISLLAVLPTDAARFRLLALDQIPGLEALQIPGPEGVLEIPVPVFNVSPDYPIPPDGRLACYDRAPAPGEERPPLFEIGLEGLTGDVIIVLFPSTTRPPSYAYQLIPDDAASFPAGSVLVYNLMPRPVAAKLGDTTVRVAQREKQVVPIVPEGAGSFEGGVAFAAEFDGYGKVFSASEWYLVRSMKMICILYQDNRGNPRVRRIRISNIPE